MKKIAAAVLSLLVVFLFYGCTKEKNNESTSSPESVLGSVSDTSVSNTSKPGVPTSESGEYIRYGDENQNLLIYKETDFGSFEKPHKKGESIRIRHSNIITSGNYSSDKKAVFDYNLTLEKVLSGKDAEKTLDEITTNFDEEKKALENCDLYLLSVNFKYNPESKVKDKLPDSLCFKAVDKDGNYVDAEVRLNTVDYTNETENGEVANWYPLAVPKGTEFRPVAVIGTPMEYPGFVANVYFDIND